MDASAWCRRRCGRPPQPTAGSRLSGSDFPAARRRRVRNRVGGEAANAEEEALAIAVALREAIETAGKTAALITPDRELARRVLAALERWHIPVDDSGGDALPDTSAGRFARLAAEAALGGLAPVTLLALLKHPLTRLGAAEGANTRAAAALGTSRLARPPSQAKKWRPCACARNVSGGARQVPARRTIRFASSDPRVYLSDGELVDAPRCSNDSRPRSRRSRISRRAAAFAELAARHCDVVTALSTDEHGRPAAFAGNDGVKLYEAFDDIARANPTPASSSPKQTMPSFSGSRLPIAWHGARKFRTCACASMVRSKHGCKRSIASSSAAGRGRLAAGDAAGSLAQPPMRHALGLDLPERRISLSAHDFAQALGADEVILAYPAKLAGTPTCHRASSSGWPRSPARHGGSRPARRAEPISTGRERSIIPPRSSAWTKPAPRPPRAARPTALSVTEIESWLRDPYTIYAKHILKLRELDAIDLPPGAADRGIVIHGALSEFTKTFAARCRPIPRRADRDRRQAFRRRSKTIPRRGRSGGHASSASRIGLPAGRRGGAPWSRRSRPKRRARSRSRSASACSRCAGAPTASKSSRRRLCHSRLQDRTGAD
jgi:ATP-dependent helicase/nuclease subunit B